MHELKYTSNQTLQATDISKSIMGHRKRQQSSQDVFHSQEIIGPVLGPNSGCMVLNKIVLE